MKMVMLNSVLPLFACLIVRINVAYSQTVYPDGGRNVIPVVRNKASKAQPYNDGTVMAHVIGSAGMNFLYYFHVLGVSCENSDPEFYKIIQKDFEFCMNKTGSLPSEFRNQPLGSIPKPCVDWKIRRPCYKNLADDYDECLVNRPGLVKKGTDALRFTHAYAKFICGNIEDTQAHLLDRYTKHDLIVDGVFQCFPHLQDRIVNCVKRDKVSKTLCSKFYIVHACFGKYYNDDNCHDVQPIYYMDDLFRNMSTSLSCPKDDNEWMTRDPTHPPGGGGDGKYPTKTPGWTHEPPKKGWTSREEHSVKENPWPGERGRPWETEIRRPFIKEPVQMDHHRLHQHEKLGWVRGEREKGYNGIRVGTTKDPHADRPFPDSSWNSRSSWVDVVDRGTLGIGSPWDQGRRQNEIDSTRSYGGGWSTTRGPVGSYQYVTSRGSSSTASDGGVSEFYYSTTPGGAGRERQSVGLPPAGYAITRTPKDTRDSGELEYYGTRASTSLASKASNSDLGFNFYSFDD